MARITFDELNTTLDQFIDAGAIYNVDYQHLKTYVGSRGLDSAISKLREEYTYAGKYQDRTDDEMDLIESLTNSIVQFPTKKTQKLLGSMDHVGSTAAVSELVEKWKPVADKFRALKPLIVKGRKPAETPRTTPVRTLENTGTCSCCGKNVKLSTDGKIVNHGFTIKWGFRQGSCYGTGFDPIEISDEGVRNFIKIIKATQNDVRKLAAKLEAGETKLTGLKLKMAIDEHARTMRWLEQDMERANDTIANWEPKPLPVV